MFFTSEPGRFQVWLPSSMSIQEFTDGRTLFGERIECPTLVIRLNGAYALLRYCDLAPASIASLSAGEILDQAHSELTRGIRVNLKTKQSVIVQGVYPALSLASPVNTRGAGFNDTVKARVVLVENRLYLIAMSVHHQNWCVCLHQVDRVVESLYINPGLSIPFEPTP